MRSTILNRFGYPKKLHKSRQEPQPDNVTPLIRINASLNETRITKIKITNLQIFIKHRMFKINNNKEILTRNKILIMS